MALAASLAMAGASIALLLVYGADVAAAQAGGGEGFLPFGHMERGIGLGLPAVALPVAAYFASRKEPSRALGAMLVAAGALVIIGGAVVLAAPAGEGAGAGEATGGAGEEGAEGGPSAGGAPLLVAGAFIIALGAMKARQR